MSTRRLCGRLIAAASLAAATLFATPSAASAQAWLPAQGEGYVSTVYTNLFVNKHYLPTTRYDIGKIDTNSFLFDASYGVTDRMAVSISLPLMISRYRGDSPHHGTQPLPMDDGTWHSTFQDFRFNIRYNVVRGPLTVTPFVGTILPSHGYEYWAHSAAGRRLTEVQAGVTAASLLDPITHGLFVQGRYAFGFSERALDIRPNHSYADVEVGYFVARRVRLFALGAGQLTHGGIDLPPVPGLLTPLQRQHHDQIARENSLNIGTGAAIEFTDSIGLFGSFLKQVAGRNGHEINRAVSLGLTWSFRRSSEPLIRDSRQRPLARCGCQKAVS